LKRFLNKPLFQNGMKKLIFVFILILILTGCTGLKKVEKIEELMGTFVTITVYEEDKDKALTSIDKAFDEIKRINNLLSEYQEKSEVD